MQPCMLHEACIASWTGHAPWVSTTLAAKRLMTMTCSSQDAATPARLNRPAMPSSLGKNWGLKPPERPASRLPGMIMLSVSGDQDCTRRTRYAAASGRNTRLEDIHLRAVRGITSICRHVAQHPCLYLLFTLVLGTGRSF